MSKEYWYCVIGPADPSEWEGNGADWPLRQAVKKKLEEYFPETSVGYTCASGWGVDSDAARQISFATASDDLKKSFIKSYYDEKKPLPRHMKAWELLFKSEKKESNDCCQTPNAANGKS